MKISREEVYVDSLPTEGNFFLAGDIGGTNSNFGVFQINSTTTLLLSIHFKSQEITDFTQVIKYLCEYIFERYKISCQKACFAVAGIIQNNRILAKPTNLPITVDLNQIKKNTPLTDIFLINDFEAVALGIELIDPKTIIQINQGEPIVHANKAFLGAGTGLGKSTLIWSESNRKYLPHPSEGGHADFAVVSKEECRLVEYLMGQKECHISWEDILSGRGLQNIYKFLSTIKKYEPTEATKEILESQFNPDRISRYSKVDPQSRDTFLLYAKFYGRCAKNFVLETLSLGGIYIAGGIAAKNVSLFFEPNFMSEFTRCGKHSEKLKNVPVYVVSDYNISLYGAVIAYQYHQKQLI